MKISKLRHFIEIQHRIESKNEFGEAEYTWEEFVKTWAEIKPITSKEFFSAQGVQNETTHRVIIRYITGIKPDMRIIFENRVFEITSIRDYFERHKFLEIMCKENLNG